MILLKIPKILTDLVLLTPSAQRECFICGCLAVYECLQCLTDHKLQPGRIKQYCTTCNTQVYRRGTSTCQGPYWSVLICKKTYCSFLLKVHTHTSRRGHSPSALSVPEGVASDASVPRHMMQLFAVLCIQTSHYVSFVKYGPESRSWLFFDSMADRCGKTNIWLFWFKVLLWLLQESSQSKVAMNCLQRYLFLSLVQRLAWYAFCAMWLPMTALFSDNESSTVVR